MQIIISWKIWLKIEKKHMFLPHRLILPSVSYLVVEMRVKSLSEFNMKYHDPWYFLIHVNSCIMIMKILMKVLLDLDIHKTLIILRINEHSWGKICTSVLLKNCSPFSIKIKVEYNTIQQIVNKYRKLLDLTIISKIFF